MNEHELERFMSKVQINSSTNCWEWKGDIIGDGYGYAYIKWKMRLAHRVSYEHFKGDILQGNQVDHKCMIKYCVNPEHLQQVDRATHAMLTVEKGENFNSNKTHCLHGHLYDKRNTYYRNGSRKCRACARERTRISREKRSG